jgi:glycosyltransferase involved in cell wall biosynthesis
MTHVHSLLWINHFAIAPTDGGGTRHVELGRELTRRNWRVTIAASDFHVHTRGYTRRPTPSLRTPIVERIDGVDLLWLWAAPYTRNDWRRGYNWLSFARSVTRWRPNGARPDVVIGSSPHLFAALAGARIARRLGVPFVLEVRDLWPESLLAVGGRKGPAYHALDAVARHLYRRAARIIVLARGSRDHLVRRGIDPQKIVHIPNGADTDAFVPRPTPGPHLTAVYAGAHGPANGLETVLDAAALLRDEPVRFLLVGDGPSKPALQADAARRGLTNVEFRAPVPKTEMPALLAAADIGLMVLREAPLFAFGVSPNKLFDYLAAALPVACNVPGEVAAMLHESGAGVQAADAGAGALAEAVRRLVRTPPAERARMGDAGCAWVAREHGRPVLAARLDGALRELLHP